MSTLNMVKVLKHEVNVHENVPLNSVLNYSVLVIISDFLAAVYASASVVCTNALKAEMFA